MAVIAVRMYSAVRGPVPNWLVPGAPLPLTLDGLLTLTMLSCWIGSVYAWSKVPPTGFLHGVALVSLIFFGTIIGPFYILLAAFGNSSQPGQRSGFPAPHVRGPDNGS